MARFGRAFVLDEHDGRVGADGELADQSIVRRRVAEDPSTAVEVENHRQDAARAGGLHDANRHVPDFGADGDPLLHDVLLLDRRGLDVVEDLPRGLDAELVEEGRLGGGVGNLLGFDFEDGSGHGVLSFRRLSGTRVVPTRALAIDVPGRIAARRHGATACTSYDGIRAAFRARLSTFRHAAGIRVPRAHRERHSSC